MSSRCCWFPQSTLDVKVDVSPGQPARVTNITRCGSPWVCPVCAPMVREHRARDIDLAVAEAIERGWSVLFVTQTLPHGQADALAPRLQLVRQALRKTLTTRAWGVRSNTLGYVGAIKAVEVTYGDHGWHPHAHSLLFFDRELSEGEVLSLRQFVARRWSKVTARAGFGVLNRRHGIDVRRVRAQNELGGYLSKVEGGWGAGLELARSDVKRKGQSPYRLLEQAAITGDAVQLERWMEYEAATKGARAIVWSARLRKVLLPEPELSDEAAAADEGQGEGVFVVSVKPVIWRRRVQQGRVADWLRRAEAAAVLVVVLTTAAPWTQTAQLQLRL